MKKNKKGFTLIELLAVIVILAIIMVIAVPQILNVIDSSRTSAWTNSLKLIANAINTNSALFGVTDTTQTYNVESMCKYKKDSNGNPTTTLTASTKAATMNSVKGELSSIVDVDDSFNTIYCFYVDDSTYRYLVKGKNQFANKKGTIECSYSGTETACVMTSDSSYIQ